MENKTQNTRGTNKYSTGSKAENKAHATRATGAKSCRSENYSDSKTSNTKAGMTRKGSTQCK